MLEIQQFLQVEFLMPVGLFVFVDQLVFMFAVPQLRGNLKGSPPKVIAKSSSGAEAQAAQHASGKPPHMVKDVITLYTNGCATLLHSSGSAPEQVFRMVRRGMQREERETVYVVLGRKDFLLEEKLGRYLYYLCVCLCSKNSGCKGRNILKLWILHCRE